MTFREWVEEYRNEEAHVLAEKILRNEPEACVAAVADRIEHLRRSWLKEAEAVHVESFLRAAGRNPVTLTVAGDDGEPRRLVLPSEPFRLGDGSKVTWGQATIEQWWQRVTVLRKIRGGVDLAIQQCLGAIKVLEETGALCLDEIKETAPLP